MRILTRYVCSEVFLNFEISLVTITSVLLSFQIGKYIHQLGTAIGLMEALPFMLPSLFVMAIPLSLLLACLLTFSRLSADKEIHAMYSCNIRFSMIMAPIIILSFFIGLFTLANSHYVVPWSMKKIFDIKNRTLLDFIQYQMVHNERYSDEQFSIIKLPTNKPEEKSVLLRSYKGGKIEEIKADSFQTDLLYDQNAMNISLSNAQLSVLDSNGQAIKEIFYGISQECQVTLPIAVKKLERKNSQKSLEELNEILNNEDSTLEEIQKSSFEIHRKLASSFICILLSLLGLFMGLRISSGNKFLGIFIVLGLVLLVYLPSLAMGKWLVYDDSVMAPGWIGGWLPVFIIALVTYFIKPKDH